MKKRKFLLTLLPAFLLLTGCEALPVNKENSGGGLNQGAETSIKIGDNGNWFIDDKDTGVKASGEDGKGIDTVQKTSTNGNVDTYTITFTDGTTTTFEVTNGVDATIKDPIDPSNNRLSRKVLEDINGRVTFKGTMTNFAGDEAAVAEDAKGFVSDLDISFTDESYFYSAVDSFGQSNVGQIYKIGGVPMLGGINLLNELVFTPMTDGSGTIYDWESYANPFKNLTIYDFEETEISNEYLLRLDTEQSVELATNFVTTLTNYNFETLGFEEIRFTILQGRISQIHIETKTAESFFGYERYEFDLEVTARGEEVPDLAYPEVYEHKAEHDKLDAALKQASTQDLYMTSVLEDASWAGGNWEEAMITNSEIYYTNDTLYVWDDYYGGQGFTNIDGQVYEIYEEGEDIVRAFYPLTDSSGVVMSDLSQLGDMFLPAFDRIAPELFNVIDDKTFELTGTFASYGGIYFCPSFNNKFNHTADTIVRVTLDDNYQLKSMVLTDEIFTRETVTFEAFGDDVHLPWEGKEFVVEEDPFLILVGKYTYTNEAGEDHTLLVNSVNDITLDGEPVENIVFDGYSGVTFTADGYEFDLNYYSSRDYYAMSISGPNDFYEYYSTTKSNYNLLLVKE